MPDTSANLSAFDKAVSWFRKRTAITDDEWDRVAERARSRAKIRAGNTQAAMVSDLFDDLERGIAKGDDFDDLKRRMRSKLVRSYGRRQPHRIEAIIRTEVQTAYMEGRYRQLKHPAVTNLRPFWIFDAVLDLKTSAICRPRNNVIRRHDDPWWDDNYPPLHINCRSGVRTMRRVDKAGVRSAPRPKGVPPQPGFGRAPVEILEP